MRAPAATSHVANLTVTPGKIECVILSSVEVMSKIGWCIFVSTFGIGSTGRWLELSKICSVCVHVHVHMDFIDQIRLRIMEERQMFPLERCVVDAAWIPWPSDMHAQLSHGWSWHVEK
jgi:hypothetical protein